MVKRTGPTNDALKMFIRNIKKEENPFWQRIARELSKPSRSRREVNLSVISRNTKSGETVAIPGKVLSSGELKYKLTIAAWQFTNGSLKKIKEAGATAITLKELHEKKKTGRLIG